MGSPSGQGSGLVRAKTRKTFGLLIDWVSMPFHAALMSAVADAAEALDFHLVCLVSGQLGAHRVTDRCRNLLASLASRDTLDGLLVSASTLEAYAGHDHVESLLSRYGDLPVVTLHDRFRDLPSVAADNGAGIDLVMDHLFRFHGYRRFAFVAGKAGRRDFDERRRRWVGYLEEHGLPLLDDLIFQGDYGPDSGAAAVRAFLPRRADFDVLVLANDAMAIGARQELVRQGGEGIPLVGFDDSDQAPQFSLTTVRQSLPSQVSLAFRLLDDLTEGRPVPLETRVLPDLILRGSCGCPHQPIRSGSDSVAPLSESDLDGLHDLGEAMFSTLDQNEEIRTAVHQFRSFGVDACCISRYDRQDDPLATAHLTVAYDGDRRYDFEGAGVQFPTRSLLPPGVLDLSQRRSLMVQALFCGPEQIGFVVFSIQTRKWRIYEMLRRELSLALKGSSLVQAALSQTGELERRVHERTAELEAAYAQLNWQYEEKSRIEAELQRREARYRELIMKTPALVLELDLQFRPRFINQSGLEMLGLENLEGRRGVSFLRYVHPDDAGPLETSLQMAVDLKEPVTGEFRLRSTTGKTASIVFEANALTHEGSVPALRMSGVNVTTLFANVARPEEVLFEHYRFSPRVRQVLELMLKGASAQDIAALLKISQNTVKTHIRSIYQEVGVTSRNGLFKILREYQVHHFGHQSYVFSMLSTLIRE